MWLDLTFKYTAIFTAIILHEIAHGYAALLMGDDTAKKEGRLSLNPLKHADLFGTFLLPLMLWIAMRELCSAGPNRCRLISGSSNITAMGIILVSAAGIIMNIWVAVISALFILLIQFIPHPYMQMILHMFFLNMAAFNIIIALFNALPIPPLDGSKILFGWSREPWAVKYVNSGKAGLAAIVFLIFIMPEIGRALGLDLNLFRTYLIGTTRYLLSLLV